MATPNSYLYVPARTRGISLALRVANCVLDFATLFALSTSVGLHQKRMPSISYSTIALKPTHHDDWTDPIVLVSPLSFYYGQGSSLAVPLGRARRFMVVSTLPSSSSLWCGYRRLRFQECGCDQRNLRYGYGDADG